MPSAREAFRHLTNDQGQFFVPTIFVTNAGNVMRQAKAKQLSDWLEVEVRFKNLLLVAWRILFIPRLINTLSVLVVFFARDTLILSPFDLLYDNSNDVQVKVFESHSDTL